MPPRRPSHNRPTPFRCPTCPQRFTTKCARDAHVLVIHKNAGKFRCDLCGKSFNQEGHCVVHRRTHTGEKPFPCTICRRPFSRKDGLRFHYLDTHAKKRFKCPTCGQEFGREYPLKIHAQVHLGKRFQCEVCGKYYKSERYRNAHQRNHSINNQQETPEQRRLVENTEAPSVEVERSNDCDQSDGDDQAGELLLESSQASSEILESIYDDESSKEETGREDEAIDEAEATDRDEAAECDNVLNEKQSRDTGDAPARVGQRRMEGDSDGQTRQYTVRPAIFSSDTRIRSSVDHQGGEPPAASLVNGVNLKLVFDVEYRAPE